MAILTRRAALTALATGAGLLGLGYVLRSIVDIPVTHAGTGLRRRIEHGYEQIHEHVHATH